MAFNLTTTRIWGIIKTNGTMELKVHLVQQQRLSLTPRMKQSLHILQLPLMELRQLIEEELTDNPLLKEATEDAGGENFEEFINYRENWQQSQAGNSEKEEELYNFRESLITQAVTLQQRLLHQLRIMRGSESILKVGEFLIGNIDDSGYLQISLEGVAKSLSVPIAEVKQTLSLIQTLEPAGIGARNLKEALLLQLKRHKRENSLAAKIVKNYLEDLGKKHYRKIGKSLNTSLEKVKRAKNEIGNLEPRPGGSLSPAKKIPSPIPDVTIKKENGKYQSILNHQYLPRLRINPFYQNFLKRGNLSSSTRCYLRKKLSNALWLIKNLQRRETTIKDIVDHIIEVQKDFLEKGASHLKPLTLKEVAKTVKRNSSTVSRAIRNKWVQTPLGNFELKRFFNGHIKRNHQEPCLPAGKPLTSQSIKTRIKCLIGNEKKKSPLSDEDILKRLKFEGIDIARRTIAKYRKQLKILPSYLRKE